MTYAVVGTTWELVQHQRDAWGPGEGLQLGTVLIVSEMVSNAVRHASTPVTLRLIRQEKLVCEVPDGSRASPHLHWTLPGDESGRGLLIVTRSVSRWGIRQAPLGKTIWTEQGLPHEPLSITSRRLPPGRVSWDSLYGVGGTRRREREW